jgi:hypothetical protein
VALCRKKFGDSWVGPFEKKIGIIKILRIILPLIKFEQSSINAAVLKN